MIPERPVERYSLINIKQIAQPQKNNTNLLVFMNPNGTLDETIANQLQAHTVFSAEIKYGVDTYKEYWYSLSTWLTRNNIDPSKLVIIGYSSGAIAALAAAQRFAITPILIAPSAIPVPTENLRQRLHEKPPLVSENSILFRLARQFERAGLGPQYLRQLINGLILDKHLLANVESLELSTVLQSTYKLWLDPIRLQELVNELKPTVLQGTADLISHRAPINYDRGLVIPLAGAKHEFSTYIDAINSILS